MVSAGGFVWEKRFPRPGQRWVTREEAELALYRLSPLARRTTLGRRAEAAAEAADWQECLECCEGAAELASNERWE